ncbi:hypothetical protein Tco_1073990, partial [Tanacetum coccineum]
MITLFVVSIILEYMDGGSLADFLKTVRSIPEPYLAAVCKQGLETVKFADKPPRQKELLEATTVAGFLLWRIRMSEENQALQKQLLEKRAKEMESLQMGEEWNDSPQSKEQKEAKLLNKYKATILDRYDVKTQDMIKFAMVLDEMSSRESQFIDITASLLVEPLPWVLVGRMVPALKDPVPVKPRNPTEQPAQGIKSSTYLDRNPQRAGFVRN